VVFFYTIVPLLDRILGEDQSNPPESAVPALDADLYYRWVTYLLAPVLWAAFIFSAWFVSRFDLPLHAMFAMVLISGSVGGFCINLGHELGHKNTQLEKWLAKIVLAPSGYGHFFIEHNRGHHRDAATPADPASSRMGESIYRFVLREMPGAWFRAWELEKWLAKIVLAPSGYGHFFIEHNRGHHRDAATPADPASSRMGESIYRFVLREMPGAWFRAWELEKSRLQKAGLPVFSLHNEIIQPALLTLALWSGLVAWLGWNVLPFLVVASFWANFQLTSANYIEHYGLLRGQRAPGKYEACQPHHSWNSNHIFSNWILFHLQRHSDHHAHPLRRYQSLRHFDNLPTLPSGYFAMFLVAYIPPLWRAVMDPRLLASVGRDTANINIDPQSRATLIARYGLTESHS
jgi:alkane 1-monooxygenase